MTGSALRQETRRALMSAMDSCAGDYLSAVRTLVDQALDAGDGLGAAEGIEQAGRSIADLYECLLGLGPSRVQKSRGSFYTPADVAGYMADCCLNVLYETAPCPHMDSLRILDPAAGCGVFLIQTAKELSARSGASVKPIVKSNLFGCDTDPLAVHISKALLGRMAGLQQDEITNVRVADSLTDMQGMYDVIIGNPPWVSLKGRHRAPQQIYTDAVWNRFGGDTYRPNIMEAFIRMSIEHLKPGGINCFIVPDRLAANRQFISLRARMLHCCRLREVVFKVPFDGVMADALIYLLVKGTCSKYISVSYWKQPDTKINLPADAVMSTANKALHHPGTSRQQRIAGQMESCSQLLSPNVASTATGFIAAKGAISPERIDQVQIPAIRGRDISAYRITGCSYFTAQQGIIGGTSSERVLQACPKILVRKTADRFIAAWCDKPIWPEQSVYQIWDAKQGYSLCFLLALLNSSLAGFYCRMHLVTNRDSMPQIKKMDLDRFPVPIISFTTPESQRRQAVAAFGIYSDLRQIWQAAEDQMLAGRSDIVHDVIAELARHICAGQPRQQVPQVVDMLVAALYRIDYGWYRAISEADPASKL